MTVPRTKETQLESRLSGKEWYLSNFQSFEKSLNGAAMSHIHSIRRAAISRFAELGFPTTRDEEWKYTDVSSLARIPFTVILGDDSGQLPLNAIEKIAVAGLTPNLIVFVNGHYSEKLSSHGSSRRDSGSVRIGSLGAAMKEDDFVLQNHLARYVGYDENGFTALNAAFLNDGAFVYVPDGHVVENPIHLLFISTELEKEFVIHPRNLIMVGKNSQASVLETYMSLAKNQYFNNVVTEIILGENAVLEHHKLQNDSHRSFHVGTTHVHQQRNSNFTSHSVSVGGALVRNNVTAVLDGEGGECTLNGLYLTTGEQHVDNHTTIDHAKSHCNSHELYKGILTGKSRGVFNGKILVRKDAQKTDAKQTNKNLVLSDDASIDTKPQLEIFANDVKCTHGATIGQLDDEAIFYLRSRGIELDRARDILIYAFASDVVDRMKIVPLRKQLHHMIHERLEQSRL